MTSRKAEPRLICFTHIQKAGGTSVEVIMRRHFGLGYMLVDPREGWIYRPQDLAADLRLNPLARHLCGHWLRPFVDFGPDVDPIWYTMVREPISRFISHYQYHLERMDSSQSFEDFLRSPIQENVQTWLIAGEQDVDAAKQILETRFRAVGVLEWFRESMLIVREALELDGLRFRQEPRSNPASSLEMRERLGVLADMYADECLERNRLDIELYRFVREEIFPRQVREYGEARLRREVVGAFPEARLSLAERLRDSSAIAFRRLVQLPVLSLRRAVTAPGGAR